MKVSAWWLLVAFVAGAAVGAKAVEYYARAKAKSGVNSVIDSVLGQGALADAVKGIAGGVVDQVI